MAAAYGQSMNERQSDFELLQCFARHGEQRAFTELVRRHLNLVYATAFRKVQDPGAAEGLAVVARLVVSAVGTMVGGVEALLNPAARTLWDWLFSSPRLCSSVT